ncbi:hypothetical protein ALON55S_01260 [Alishewanella longhuensis]
MLVTVFLSWLLLQGAVIPAVPDVHNEVSCCVAAPAVELYHDVSGNLTLNDVKARFDRFCAIGWQFEFWLSTGSLLALSHPRRSQRGAMVVGI